MRCLGISSIGRAGSVAAMCLAHGHAMGGRRSCSTKNVLDPPTRIDSGATIVNYLSIMKREHQVHRLSVTAEHVRGNVRQLLHKLPSDASYWLTLESALAMASACAYFNLRHTEHLGIVRALTLLSDALNGKRDALSLEAICRIALAAAGIHMLEGNEPVQQSGPLSSILQNAPVRLAEALSARAHPFRLLDNATGEVQAEPLSALEASLSLSASHKLRQAVGVKPVLAAFAAADVSICDVTLLLDVLLQSRFARDQLISVLANVVSEDTLRCFVHGSLKCNRDSLCRDMEALALKISGIWFAVLDQDNARFFGKHKMKSYHCASLMSIAGRICVAGSQATNHFPEEAGPASPIGGGDNSTLGLLAAAIGRIEADGDAHRMISAPSIEYLMQVATGVVMHFSAGEHSVFLSSLSKVYASCVLGRVDATLAGCEQQQQSVGDKAGRFKRRGQQVAVQPVETVKDVAKRVPPQACIRFFDAEKDDDVEFESTMLACVDNSLNWLCIQRTINSNRESHTLNVRLGKHYTLKELAMLRRALNIFGVPCDFLDRGIMHRLAAMHSAQRTSSRTLHGPLEAVRAVVPLLQAPQRDVSAVNAVRVLHHVADCILPAIAVQQCPIEASTTTSSDGGRISEGGFVSTGDVVELLHALVCDGGLTHKQGVYRHVIAQCAMRINAAVTVGQLRPHNRMMLAEALIRYCIDSNVTTTTHERKDPVAVESPETVCLRVLVGAFSSIVGPYQDGDSRPEKIFDDVRSLRHWPTLADALATALSSNPKLFGLLASTWSTTDEGRPPLPQLVARLQHRVDALSRVAATHVRRLDLGLVARDCVFDRRYTQWSGRYLWHESAFQAKVAASLKAFRWPSTMLSIAIHAQDDACVSDTNGVYHSQQLDECWSSARTAVRSFGQLTTLVVLVHQAIPDAILRPSAAPTLESLVVRKTDHLLVRTSRPDDIVRLLHCIGANDRLCASVVRVLERDATTIAQTFTNAIVSPQRMQTALAALHPNTRLRCMHATAFLAKLAIWHCDRLDDILAILLEYGYAGSDAVVDVAHAIPQALIAAPREPLNSALVVKMLEFFRVGRQPKAVRRLRTLFGTVLTSAAAVLRMPFADVLRLVDVPEGEREGRFWNICRRALFMRVRIELEAWCAALSAEEGGPLIVPEALRALTWEHWSIVFSYAPRDHSIVVPTAFLIAQMKDEGQQHWSPTTEPTADDGSVDVDANEPMRRGGVTRSGASLLMYLAAQRGGSSETVTSLLRPLGPGPLVQLIEAVADHWDALPLRPQVDDILQTGCAMDAVRSWVGDWTVPGSDDELLVRATELNMFASIVDLMCSTVIQPELPLDGACLVKVLSCCSHWKGDALLAHVDAMLCTKVRCRSLHSTTTGGNVTLPDPTGGAPSGGSGTGKCAQNVHRLVSWCQEEIRVLAMERTWLEDGQSSVAPSPQHAMADPDLVSLEARLWSIAEYSLRLQWADIDNDLRNSTAYALGSLTADAACALWLQARWLQASGPSTAGQCTAWCEQLQAALVHQIALLLQSANGCSVAEMVALLVPEPLESTARADRGGGEPLILDPSVGGILAKVPVLMANDLDNFSTRDVLSIVPRLASAGYLPQQSLDAMLRLCENSVHREIGGDVGAQRDATPSTPCWVPLVREGSGARGMNDFRGALEMLKQYRPLATAASLRLDDI